jgi:hypothetical protein
VHHRCLIKLLNALLGEGCAGGSEGVCDADLRSGDPNGQAWAIVCTCSAISIIELSQVREGIWAKIAFLPPASELGCGTISIKRMQKIGRCQAGKEGIKAKFVAFLSPAPELVVPVGLFDHTSHPLLCSCVVWAQEAKIQPISQ